MTKISKRVVQMSEAVVRDCGKLKRLVIAIYPSDIIGLRPEKTKREEFISMAAVYDHALKKRIAAERIAKRKGKGK